MAAFDGDGDGGCLGCLVGFIGIAVAVVLVSWNIAAGVIFFIVFSVGCILIGIWAGKQEDMRVRALELADVDDMSGIEFERYVAKLLVDQGYQVEVTRGSGDLGVDIVAERFIDKYAIQVKRQTGKVSRRAVSDAVAGKDHYGCNAAMVVTNSYFSEGAKELARSTECELVDRDVLAEWILKIQMKDSPGALQ